MVSSALRKPDGTVTGSRASFLGWAFPLPLILGETVWRHAPPAQRRSICFARTAHGNEVERLAFKRDVVALLEAFGIDDVQNAFERIRNDNLVARDSDARPRIAPVTVYAVKLGQLERDIGLAGDYVDAVQLAVLGKDIGEFRPQRIHSEMYVGVGRSIRRKASSDFGSIRATALGL